MRLASEIAALAKSIMGPDGRYIVTPYGREIKSCCEHLLFDYETGDLVEAIVLIPGRTDTRWFRLFRDFAICFVRGRVKFGESKHCAPFPSAAVYLGTDVAKFAKAFEDIGRTWIRWKVHAGVASTTLID